MTQGEWDSVFDRGMEILAKTHPHKSLEWRRDKAHARTVAATRMERPGGPPLWLRAGGAVVGEGGNVTKVWNWFNGKKTLIGSILVGVPAIWEILREILASGGVADTTIVAIGGIIALVVGWSHKILKVTGLAVKPDALKRAGHVTPPGVDK